MASAFNPKEQFIKTESRIVAALERVSEAFRVLLWSQGKANGLSPIQIQVLIFLLFHSREKGKVSYLADEFNMTKATISDSVKILLQKRLVEKLPDENDTRSFSIVLTKTGKTLAQQSAAFAGVMEQPLAELSGKQKEIMLDSLLQLIERLNNAGIITAQRMCFNCRFFDHKNNRNYCQLLQKPLAGSDLQVDCPEHELHV